MKKFDMKMLCVLTIVWSIVCALSVYFEMTILTVLMYSIGFIASFWAYKRMFVWWFTIVTLAISWGVLIAITIYFPTFTWVLFALASISSTASYWWYDTMDFDIKIG